MKNLVYVSLTISLLLSSCGTIQNSGKLSFRKVEQSEKEMESKHFISEKQELDLAESETIQTEKREEAPYAIVEVNKNAEPKAIKNQNSKKFTAQNFSTVFKPVKQGIQQGKKVTKKLTPQPMDSGVKKAILFLIAAILLALLGAVFYYNLGVFGMILGIIFYIGAAVYFVVAIIMLIAG